MQVGHNRRHTESTEANDTSSRSHALCLVRESLLMDLRVSQFIAVDFPKVEMQNLQVRIQE